MINITLQKIRDNSPCVKGWEKVFSAHKHLGMDTEFPLTSVLNSNDLEGTLWCLNCLPEYDFLWRKFAVWCARQVEHLMTDERSINALSVALRYADGLATDEELSAARDAARDAAWSSASEAAWAAGRAATRDAAWAAERAATRDGVWAAVGDTAWAAARAAESDAARDAQQKKLTEILTAGEWVD